MSLPPINPKPTTSGITLDPRTLERVVAPTKRADGSVRKEIKIRPGYTPQEDVGTFRTQRQQAAASRASGPRVVPGWAPPPEPAKKPPKPKAAVAPKVAEAKKEKVKKEKKKVEEVVKDDWEDDEDPTPVEGGSKKKDDAVDELVKKTEGVDLNAP